MPNKNPKKQNPVQRLIGAIDHWQRKHRFSAFPYGVVKKYGDDESGYQAALITYYSFVSLFPLLIIALSVIDLISRNNTELRNRLTQSIGNYLPTVSDQLQHTVHSKTGTGLALLISLLFLLYGAKGSADAVRHALDHAWEVPRSSRSGFPKGMLKSLGLIVGGGVGLLLSATLSGLATSAFAHLWYLRLLPLVLSISINYLVFLFVFRIGTSKRQAIPDIRLGAITAALALQLLQLVGAALIHHQLKNATGAYGQFGIVLALLFWIYLQAQVFMYTVQINVVHTYKLWPRSLTGKDLTVADDTALELYAKRERLQASEKEAVDVKVLADS
jgi:membrane protein